MRISDWSSDVCSSDLGVAAAERHEVHRFEHLARPAKGRLAKGGETLARPVAQRREARVHVGRRAAPMILAADDQQVGFGIERLETDVVIGFEAVPEESVGGRSGRYRSEEHTSELQSLMRNSYAVFWLKK